MPEAAAKAARDMAHSKVGLFLWGLPLIAILATAFDGAMSVTRGVIWALALLWAGATCLTNACRSGRLHCYVTGPFFVALGTVSLLHGVGVLPLGTHGWRWIGVTRPWHPAPHGLARANLGQVLGARPLLLT
jgi:hypothetical protein